MISCICALNWKLGQNGSKLAHLHGFHGIRVFNHMITPPIRLLFLKVHWSLTLWFNWAHWNFSWVRCNYLISLFSLFCRRLASKRAHPLEDQEINERSRDHTPLGVIPCARQREGPHSLIVASFQSLKNSSPTWCPRFEALLLFKIKISKKKYLFN